MKNAEELREYHRQWRLRNKERCRLVAKAWRDSNRDRWTAVHRAYRAAHKERESELQRLRNHRTRMQILSALGSGCACCGERAVSMLDVDHVKNDGAAHRAERRQRASYWVYKDIIASNYDRTRFQILCRNCNWSKFAAGGRCEHELIRGAHNALVA